MTATLDLSALDTSVEAALTSRDETALHVLGYGEISTVLAWPSPEGPFACKRLPTFDDPARFDAYRRVFDASIATLAGRGLTVHPTSLEALPRPDGTVASYCVQRVLPRATLAPERLRVVNEPEGRMLLARIADAIGTVVDERVGLDAQLSNWAEADGDLVYLDVTTPLLRDDAGADLLDTELFLSSIPAALRPIVRRFVLPSILDTYFEIRPIALDLVGNLHKEHLDEWIRSGGFATVTGVEL